MSRTCRTARCIGRRRDRCTTRAWAPPPRGSLRSKRRAAEVSPSQLPRATLFGAAGEREVAREALDGGKGVGPPVANQPARRGLVLRRVAQESLDHAGGD